MGKMRPSSSSCLHSKMEPQAASAHPNSNVLNILPVTTLRTIDLEGEKNSSPLFSRFCTEQRVFFEGDYAPKCVHANQNLASRWNKRSPNYENDAAWT